MIIIKTKILAIIILNFLIIAIFNLNVVQAEGIQDVITGGDSFLDSGKKDTKVNYGELKKTSSEIYNILLIIGIAIAVLTASILGIKFMIGSVEEKAQIKDAMIPFIIGCIVVFGAFGFWKIFVTIGNNFAKTSSIQKNISIIKYLS